MSFNWKPLIVINTSEQHISDRQPRHSISSSIHRVQWPCCDWCCVLSYFNLEDVRILSVTFHTMLAIVSPSCLWYHQPVTILRGTAHEKWRLGTGDLQINSLGKHTPTKIGFSERATQGLSQVWLTWWWVPADGWLWLAGEAGNEIRFPLSLCRNNKPTR